MPISLNGDGIISGVSTLTTPLTGVTTFSSVDATNLSVSGAATVAAGSTSSPSITTSGDDNTGIFFPSADTISFTTGGTERGRWISGGGLTFNGDTAAVNALDDYEEGTWTPSVTNMTTTGSPAYGGRYRKIGSQVTVWFFTTTLGGVATYASTANSTSVSGLPFVSGYDGPNASGGPPGVAINGTTTAGGFIQGPAPSSSTFYFDTTIAATQGMSASLTYYV